MNRTLIAAVLTLAALVLGSLLAYREIFIPSRERYLVERDLRALGVIAERFEQRIANAGILQRYANDQSEEIRQLLTQLKCDDAHAGSKTAICSSIKLAPHEQENLRRYIELIPGFRYEFRKDFKALSLESPKINALWAESVGSHRQSDVDSGWGGESRPLFTSDSELVWPFAGGNLGQARARISDLLDQHVTRSPLAEFNFFLADSEGRVVYTRGSFPIRLRELIHEHSEETPSRGGSTQGSRTVDEKPAASGETRVKMSLDSDFPPFEDLQRSSRVSRAALTKSVEYVVFTHPVHITQPEGSSDPAHAWILGAVTDSHSLESDARAISPSILGGAGILALLVVLSLPIVKLWTLGRRERLTGLDVRLAGGALVLLTGTATIGILFTDTRGAIKRAADDEMVEVANQIAANFHDEVSEASQLLQSFANCRLEARKPNGTTLHKEAILKSSETACFQKELDQYPLVTMLVLGDAAGEQFEKWTVSDATTPFISMDWFDVFREARFHGSSFSVTPISDGPLYLGVMDSPNTGETLAVLSRWYGEPVVGPQKKVNDDTIALLIPRLVSLNAPVLPSALQLAVVESGGRVLFHSNPDKRLYEDLFLELDDARAVRGAIRARGRGFATASYHGRSSRVLVAPLAGTPWAIVLLRETGRESQAVLEIAAATAPMFFGAVALGGLALLLAPLRLGGAWWLWPQPEARVRYARCIVVLGSVAMWFALITPRVSSTARLALAVLVPVGTLAALRLYLASPPTGRGRRVTRLAVPIAVVCSLLALIDPIFLEGTPRVASCLLALLLSVDLALAGETPPPRMDRVLRTHWTKLYAGVGVASLILVAVLPSRALFWDARDLGLATLTRFRLLETARAFASHRQRAASELRGINGGELARRQVGDGNIARALGDLKLGECSFTNGEPPRWTPLEAIAEESFAAVLPGACDGPILDVSCQLARQHISSLVMGLDLPGIHDPALHAVLRNRSEDDTWKTVIDRQAVQSACLELDDPRLCSPEDGTRCAVGITGVIPSSPTGSRWLAGLLSIAGILAASWLVAAVSRRVFGLGDPASMAAPVTQDEAPSRGYFLLRASSAFLELTVSSEKAARGVADGEVTRLDFRSLERLGDYRRLFSNARLIVVEGLEHRIDEQPWRRHALELLEAVVLRGQGWVLVQAEIDPLAYFSSRIKSAGDPRTTENYVSEEEFARWATVFERLLKRRFDLPDDVIRRPGEPGPMEALVESELRSTPQLRAIRRFLVAGPMQGWRQLGRRSLIEFLTDEALAHYELLWSRCNDEERLTLIQLVNEGFVNPEGWKTVARLERRGLVRRDPSLRIMNESFAGFVAQAETQKRVLEWEHVEGPSAYDRLRGGVIAVFLAGGIFLALTQPDVLTRSIGALTGLVGGAGALLQMLSYLRSGRGDTAA